MSNICLVGDVLVDVSLRHETTSLKMRLGGIMHAARALWAMNIPYSLAYIAPQYLDSQIADYISYYNCNKLLKIGNVMNSPYVMLIEELKEIGIQGYEMLLRDNIKITYDEAMIKNLNDFDELFFISGNYDFDIICEHLSERIKKHYDIANNISDIKSINSRSKFENIFISTSSRLFSKFCSEQSFSIINFFDQFRSLTNRIILKENRGGSRFYDFEKDQLHNIPSQTQRIVHSVGVGDVYDSAYMVLSQKFPYLEALYTSSWIATEYAKTTYPNDFKKMVGRILKMPPSELVSMSGCLLPWELRQKCHIYIAAPDFENVDTKLIDTLEQSLRYHNFVPHRPIKENGLMEANATKERKQFLFNKDIELLSRCNLLILVLLYNDPGSLIELGLAAQKNIPTIVFDPYKIAKNCILTELPNIITSDLDYVLSEVFNIYSKTIS